MLRHVCSCRVLELLKLLERYWNDPTKGYTAYQLILLSHVANSVKNEACSEITWMSEMLMNKFEETRRNPFSLKHVKICTRLSDLQNYPGPKVSAVCRLPFAVCRLPSAALCGTWRITYTV